jgi:hypothetical protein
VLGVAVTAESIDASDQSGPAERQSFSKVGAIISAQESSRGVANA